MPYQVCVLGPIGKTKWPPWPLIGWDIFDFSFGSAKRNSTKLGSKQVLNVPSKFVFLGPIEKKTKWPPDLWLAEIFSTSPLKPLNRIQWKLTGSKISTSSTEFVFSGRPVNINGHPVRSVKKVAHCTRYLTLWASGYLSFKWSYVAQGRTTSYKKKKMKSLYIFLQRNALIDIKISMINMAPIPKSLIFSLPYEWNFQ